ncbi:MAG TPA: STAS domain-containing protein [Solirubrobacteraceae bacterium]|nr:STAS domain-containing protein [Solirubrobacteraceae bacterium]
MSSPPPGLVVGIVREPKTIKLVLAGELDLAAAPAFERQLEEILGEDARSVTIDLQDLRFLDSAGLRALLVAHRRLTDSGRELLLAPGPRAVQRLFELTRTDRIFRFVA